MNTAYQKRQGFAEGILPPECRVEVAELAGALKDGLTPSGVKAALVIAPQMLKTAVASGAGTNGKHQAQRQAPRHGHQGGIVPELSGGATSGPAG